MSPSLINQPFGVCALQKFHIGRRINGIDTGIEEPTMVRGRGWSLPIGAYTAFQIVEACAPLLETVLHHLGTDSPSERPARDMLLESLASNLSLGTRESSLHIPAEDAGRKEIADQAVKIGKTLVSYAREVGDAPLGGLQDPQSFLEHLMQIYNEYLHQMVLLRDALLPFENFEDVVIPIVAPAKRHKLGMRYTEPSRMTFIAELMTKQVAQKSIFNYTMSLLAPSLSTNNGYGFQFKHGVVLPAAIAGSSSRGLMRYMPVVLDGSAQDVVFEYQLEDYYSPPRAEVSAPMKTVPEGQEIGWVNFTREADPSNSSLIVAKGASAVGAAELRLHLEYEDGTVFDVDVGQIARGWRYAYKVRPAMEKPATNHFSTSSSIHLGSQVLAQSGENGLVTAKNGGIHLIQTCYHLELLALLGRLYPDNTIVLEAGGSLKEAELAGQALTDQPRFVLCDASTNDAA